MPTRRGVLGVPGRYYRRRHDRLRRVCESAYSAGLAVVGGLLNKNALPLYSGTGRRAGRELLFLSATTVLCIDMAPGESADCHMLAGCRGIACLSSKRAVRVRIRPGRHHSIT